MNWLLLFITFATLTVAGIRSLVDYLNWKRSRTARIPAEFDGLFTEEKFAKAQGYLGEQTKWELIQRGVWTTASLLFLWLGGFALVDRWASGLVANPLLVSLLFFLGLGVLSEIISFPFSWHHTFGTEEKFGFNRSTKATFLGDQVKGWVLGLLIGGPILAGLFWFFQVAGSMAWLYAWGFLAVITLVLSFLAPVVLMPLFNKFTPLPEGELKAAIEAYASKVQFKLQGIFTMDGSKRSAKANAFFTGLGKFRRIVLFDTLVKQHPTKELVAVLAHEVGHFKRGHIPRMLLASLFSTFVLFFLLSLVMRSEAASLALGFDRHTVHSGFIVAFWLYGPLSLLLGLATQSLSRKHEFEADAFAAETTGDGLALAEALKRLSVESLSNLDPHPWKVWLEYSHPPVVQRVRVLKAR